MRIVPVPKNLFIKTLKTPRRFTPLATINETKMSVPSIDNESCSSRLHGKSGVTIYLFAAELCFHHDV